MPTPVGGEMSFLQASSVTHLSRDADQPAARRCSGFAPMVEEPGIASPMSRTPAELRAMPLLRPPVVYVRAVDRTSMFWIMAHSLWSRVRGEARPARRLCARRQRASHHFRTLSE